MVRTFTRPAQYNFADQDAIGKKAEAILDQFFRDRGWEVVQASQQLQEIEIDRILRKNHIPHLVEYKCDTVCQRTGNIFVETGSEGQIINPGWAVKSCAQFIAFYLEGLNRVMVFRLSALRERLPRWERTYPKKIVKNRTHNGFGYAVPLTEFVPFAKMEDLK